MSTDSPVNLAAANPYVTEFEATVRSIDGRNVTLDRTHFYPEGGGQPADRGTMEGVSVADVRKEDGVTVHVLDADPPFEAGETVAGRVDEAFRTYCMRAHTASHVVYGAGRNLLGNHGYGGFDIGEERIRLDFATTSDVDAVNPLTVQRMVNEVVWEARPVDWYEMDADRAEADDEIVFNLGDGVETTDTVRIVDIDGWDVSACGGTHVENTLEVGPVTVLDVSNPGADLVRVEYAVGPEAISRAVAERRNAMRAAEALDTNTRELPERAEHVVAENRSLRSRVEELGARLLDARLSRIGEEAVAKGGERWAVGTVEAVGSNAVADRIADVEHGDVDVVALAGANGSTFVVVGTSGDTDATAVVEDLTDEFGGGGGGHRTLAQAGGMGADPEAVAEFLRELRTDG